MRFCSTGGCDYDAIKRGGAADTAKSRASAGQREDLREREDFLRRAWTYFGVMRCATARASDLPISPALFFSSTELTFPVALSCLRLRKRRIVGPVLERGKRDSANSAHKCAYRYYRLLPYVN